jgi:hypothetical protein
MSDRPADTIERLADYLWWLLPGFLKKKERAASLVARFCDVWGGTLDTARATLVDIIPQLVVETASGEYLDMLARACQIFRGQDETDESLRTRVLAAHEIKRRGGTIPGMENGLAAIGYTAEVEEPNKGTDKWSRFVVKALGWDGAVTDQKVFHQAVRQLKPAHTRALIDPLLPLATWDDWELDVEPQPLDEGFLDEWLPTE